MADLGPPPAGEAPPPTYAPSQPQILITPLPDSASFFWGQTVQGEVFVKGLGALRANGVRSLTAQLRLTNYLPTRPAISLYDFPPLLIWPPPDPGNDASTSSPPNHGDTPFPTAHRFTIPLPASLPSTSTTTSNSATETPDAVHALPGTLNLSAYSRGEIRWTLSVNLQLPATLHTEEIFIEGTPQDASPSALDPDCNSPHEVETILDQRGVRSRLLIDDGAPRLGTLLRLGLEIKAKEREKTGVAGLSSQPDPSLTLRPLRRVRVELFRRVRINDTTDIDTHGSSSSAAAAQPGVTEHLTLLHASGKSLRYPGSSPSLPPLRVLFTLPTVQLGASADQSWGEITMTAPYHSVSFFARVTIGFATTVDSAAHALAAASTGAAAGAGGGAGAGVDLSGVGGVGGIGGIGQGRDWVLEREVRIRPKAWKEPRNVVVERGMVPSLGGDAELPPGHAEMSEEELAREAYRQKGQDLVGSSGTFRAPDEEVDMPPPFDGVGGAGAGGAGGAAAAGPSNHNDAPMPGMAGMEASVSGPGVAAPSAATGEATRRDGAVGQDGRLPTFGESQAQMAAGEAPWVSEPVVSERLVPPDFSDTPEEEDRATMVGRRGSLGGELGTWVEYDGYETFSLAPPPLDASYGASGFMDPPQPEDEDSGANANLVGGMVARLGLESGGVGGVGGGMALMEQLGLGEGTRVVDMQDDLPPGIDEPSLPALPSFHTPPYNQPPFRAPPPPHHPHPPHGPAPGMPGMHDVSPPSFAASEAAQAAGGVASAVISSTRSLSGLGQHQHQHQGIDMGMGMGLPVTTGVVGHGMIPRAQRRGSVHTHPQGPEPVEDDTPLRGDPPGYSSHAAGHGHTPGAPSGGPPAYS